MLRGAEILMAAAPRLEERDLLRSRAAGPLPAGKLKAVGNVLLAQQAIRQRLADVTAMVARREPGVDEDAGATYGRVVGFPHVRPETADEIEMGTGLEPFAADDRRRRHRCTGDDIGPGNS